MRRACFILVVFVLMVMTCKSPTKVPLFTDLSGNWQFRFDPNSLGESEYWFQDRNDKDWFQIKVPNSYNAAFPDSNWYQGKGWYRMEFQIPTEWGEGRVIIKFLGVAIRCKVWLNGEFVGEHLFPYTGFRFDITDKITKTGKNLLVVMADNEILDMAIPDKKWTGWWNFGGINRQVFLEHCPEIAIEDATVTTTMTEGGKWRLRVTVQIQNKKTLLSGSLKLEVVDRNGKKKWRLKQRQEFPPGLTQLEFTEEFEGIEPWSPDTPNLYSLKLHLEGEDGSEHSKDIRFGFRQIDVQGTKIYLNGKVLQIKGISRHEFWPGSGMTVSELRTRLDLQDIKTLGCNIVRLAHYSQHPHVYDLCDELGLLVWSEIPAWQTDVKVLADSQVFDTFVKPQLQAMIEEHRNHPSVIVWSVGNEFKSDEPEAVEYVRRATEFVRSMDPTRLVTFASDRHEKDLCYEFVDVIAINEYYGWYYGTIHDIGGVLDNIHAKWPDKPILVAEVGSGSVIGWWNPNPGDSGKDYSESYQIKFLTTHLRQIYDPVRHDHVAGGILWLYNDFPDPQRIGHGHPPLCNYVNCKGLLTQDRQKKRAFEVVRELFSVL